MKTLGFIGAGQIGGTFMGGLKQFSSEIEYYYYEISEARCHEVEMLYGISAEKSIADLMTKSEIPFISIIPQVFRKVAPEVAENYREGQIIVSAMAGIDIEEIAEQMPEGVKIARIMPNMALELGAGTGMMSFNDAVTNEERETLVKMFSPLGLIMEITEDLMDAATSLAGSTPAFFYTMVDAMMLGGVKIGFTREQAEKIALWSMYGAAKMMLDSGKTASFHRDQMMAGYGTTNAGVCKLEEENFRGAIINAVEESCRQSKEMYKDL
ncbi:pyrroline-5-carboxylate reductase [Eubacterium limosum]|uniref:pyrroline-5-carboxylate reductase n=1 Tax=Eubacterium limosum TaxID=1736 RepID=UPI001FAA0F7B|nr:pyrroline-5-carboxylate reductase [Eubacterium limosum]